MSLTRKLIRHEIRDFLLGATSAGDRVVCNRSEAPWTAALPAISIYTHDDPAEKQDDSPRRYKHTLRVAVEILAREENGEPVDDDLDDLGALVFQLIESRHQELVDRYGLHGGESGYRGDDGATEGDGARRHGAQIMTWAYVYYREAPASDPGGGWDLAGIDVDWHLNGGTVDGAPHAEDDIATDDD